MYESLLELDLIRINFPESGNIVLNIVLVLIMFGVALGMRIDHFKTLIRSPKPIIIGLFLQFIFLPFITFILVIIFNKVITPTAAMGMILVAACPGSPAKPCVKKDYLCEKYPVYPSFLGVVLEF